MKYHIKSSLTGETEVISKHAHFLYNIIHERKLKIIAEVGLWKAHLAMEILNSSCKHIVEEYWGIDPWMPVPHLKLSDSRLSRFDPDGSKGEWEKLYWKSCKYMIEHPQLRILRMTSLDAAQMFENKKYFDLVFIDASHTYDECLLDIKAWVPLIKDTGIMSGHDYMNGRHQHQGVTEAIHTVFKQEKIRKGKDRTWHIPISDI